MDGGVIPKGSPVGAAKMARSIPVTAGGASQSRNPQPDWDPKTLQGRNTVKERWIIIDGVWVTGALLPCLHLLGASHWVSCPSGHAGFCQPAVPAVQYRGKPVEALWLQPVCRRAGPFKPAVAPPAAESSRSGTVVCLCCSVPGRSKRLWARPGAGPADGLTLNLNLT